MTDATPVWNLAPAVRLALLGLVVAAAPLAWVWARHRAGDARQRLRALTLVTLFLTFDLILFGAFTRLTDSGLGCPDWPGCYGSVSPIGAAAHIDQAEAAMPTGPVTTEKAWIEMIHRYLASGVGVLILVMTITAWVLHRRGPVPGPGAWAGGAGDRTSMWAPGEGMPSPWWPTLTLVWVCAQGAFGALTVTMKLYPAIVTLHLLGGLGLLALLAVQAEKWRRPTAASERSPLPGGRLWRWAVLGLFALSVMQVALGGWVSTNYAVLACTDFPTCHGRWWPDMDFREGFAVLRPLGLNAQGSTLEMDALVAIHYTHRLMAYVVLAALVAAAVAWWRHGSQGRRWGLFFLGVAAWQSLTGISNVVLGWPLLAAVSHTGGAAVLLAGLATLWMRTRAGRSVQFRA